MDAPEDRRVFRPDLKELLVSWLLVLFVIGIFAVASIDAQRSSNGIAETNPPDCCDTGAEISPGDCCVIA